MKRVLALLPVIILFSVLSASAQAVIDRTPGWHKLVTLPTACPANGFNGSPPYQYASNCFAKLAAAWNSAIIDTKRNRYIWGGGGHGDYYGNEVYSLELNNIGTVNPLIYRLDNPSVPNQVTYSDPLSDGNPASRHTYGALLYLPAQDQYWQFGGSLAPGGNSDNLTWTLDMGSVLSSCGTTGSGSATCTPTWTNIGGGSYPGYSSPVPPGADVYGATADLNQADGLVYYWDQGGQYTWNPSSHVWTNIGSTVGDSHETGLIDQKRQLYYYMGPPGGAFQGQGVRYMSIAAGSSYTVTTPGSLPGCGGTGSTSSAFGDNYPGAAYDPITDQFLIYPNGGNTLYWFNPGTNSCTSETYGSTVGTDYPSPSADSAYDSSGTHNGQGTIRLIQYVPQLDIFVICGAGNDQGGDTSNNACWYFTPRRGDPLVTNSTGGTLTNQPITIGQPLRDGDIGSGKFPQPFINGTAATTWQADCKNAWPDGSQKYCIESFIIPSIANGAQDRITYGPNASANSGGAAQTKTQMLAGGYNFDAQIQLTGTASHNISAFTILNGASSISDCTGSDPDGTLATSGVTACYWLKGPVVTGVILEDRNGRSFDVNTDAGTGNPLHPRFEAWFYPQTDQVLVGYTLEDAWASTTATSSARDQTIATFTLTAGKTSPTTVFSYSTSFAELNRTIIHKSYCANGTGVGDIYSCTPLLTVDHVWPYWAETNFFPHWDTTTPAASGETSFVTSSLITANTNNDTYPDTIPGNSSGIGNYDTGFDSGGVDPVHGPLTTWDIIGLISQDPGVQATMLRNADLGGRLPYFYREADASAGHGQFFDAPNNTVSTLGRIVSINARTQVNLLDTTAINGCNTNYSADWINLGSPAVDSLYPIDSSHWPNLAYASYLMTGRYDYYEEQLMQSAYAVGLAGESTGDTRACVQASIGALRQGSAGYWENDQERGNDWQGRENMLGAFIAVDGSPEKAYLLDKVNVNIATWEGVHSITCDVIGTGIFIPYCTGTNNAWTQANTYRISYSTSVGTTLGSWTTGLSAYVANAPLNQTGSNSPASANSHFQNAYSATVLDWADRLGYCPHVSGGYFGSGSGCQVLGYTSNYWINEVMNPATNQYHLVDYVYPTLNNSSGAITTWTSDQTFYASQTSAWGVCTAQEPDESYQLEGEAALSYYYNMSSSQGGYSGATAYTNVRTGIGCINNSTGWDFASSSPKWDITPDNFTAQSSQSTPSASYSFTGNVKLTGNVQIQ